MTSKTTESYRKNAKRAQTERSFERLFAAEYGFRRVILSLALNPAEIVTLVEA